jgi:hypothetical protein
MPGKNIYPIHEFFDTDNPLMINLSSEKYSQSTNYEDYSYLEYEETSHSRE